MADNTLEATEKAIKEITKEEGDDYIVIVLSDANLRRYGIRPETLGKILSMDPRVTASVIFIGTLGEEAEILRRRLPSGKGHVAMNTADVPMVSSFCLLRVFEVDTDAFLGPTDHQADSDDDNLER